MKSLVKAVAIALTSLLLLSGTSGGSVAIAKDKAQKCSTQGTKKVAGKKGTAKKAAKVCKVKKTKKTKTPKKAKKA